MVHLKVASVRRLKSAEFTSIGSYSIKNLVPLRYDDFQYPVGRLTFQGVFLFLDRLVEIGHGLRTFLCLVRHSEDLSRASALFQLHIHAVLIQHFRITTFSLSTFLFEQTLLF